MFLSKTMPCLLTTLGFIFISACGVGSAEVITTVGDLSFDPTYTVHAFEIPRPEGSGGGASTIFQLSWISFDPKKGAKDYSNKESLELKKSFVTQDSLVLIIKNSKLIKPGFKTESYQTANSTTSSKDFSFWVNFKDNNANYGSGKRVQLTLEDVSKESISGRISLYVSNLSGDKANVKTGKVAITFTADRYSGKDIEQQFQWLTELAPELKELLW